MLQSLNTNDGLVLLIDLAQGHGQTLEAVDATGEGVEIDVVPSGENGVAPRL